MRTFDRLLLTKKCRRAADYDDLLRDEAGAVSLRLLLQDNRTEYPATINALSRFNVYQELGTAALYRALASSDKITALLPGGASQTPFAIQPRSLQSLTVLRSGR